MTDFKAKMHQIRFRLGLCPRPRWGSLQRSPRPSSWVLGPTSKERGKEGREGEGRGGEGKGHEPPHYLDEVYAYAVNLSEYINFLYTFHSKFTVVQTMNG